MIHTCRSRLAVGVTLLVILSPFGPRAYAQDPAEVEATDSATVHPDSVVIRFVEADLRTVISALSRYVPKPVVLAAIPAKPVSLETPGPVARTAVLPLLKGIAEAHGLEFTDQPGHYRIVGQEPGSAAARRAEADGVVQLFVVRLKHARAADVAATVNQLFAGGGGGGGVDAYRPGTLSEELRRGQVPAADPPAGLAAPPARNAAVLSGPVTVIPDAMTNSLLVRGKRTDFEVLRSAVEQLDIRPLQVLIEVLIIETREDRAFSLGADLILPPQPVDGDATVDADLAGGGLGDLVLRLMDLGRANLDVIIRAAQSRGDVRIVSRPVLVTSNNQEARFLVGTQRPFVQVSRSLPTDAPQRDQVIQYRDVGTKLTVLPTINQDGYVSLFIQQEINAATNETQFDAPVISTREAVTQVLVKDGQTIVLGGLRDEQRDNTARGVPLLSQIPLIGWIFGGVSRRKTGTELYLFLTPRILRSDDDVEAITRSQLPGNVPASVVPSPGAAQ